MPKFLDIVSKQTDRAIQITQGLLTFSRHRGDSRARHCLNELVEDVLNLAERELEKNDIVVERQIGGDLPAIPMDAAEIQQVLLNLVINARQAIGRGGRLTISTSRSDGMAVVEVADTGTGIEEKNLPQIFDPFFSTRGAPGGGEGHGLGLSVSHNIVKKHNGSIRVWSDLGVGTRFTVCLPLEPLEEPSAGTQPPVPALAGSGTARRVLVVDDDEDVRSLIEAIVTDLGCRVEGACDGPEAMEKIGRNTYDCIFLDLNMPGGVGGVEILKAVRARVPATRMIVVSGKLVDSAERELIVQEADEFIRKPFDVATIRNVLNNRAAREKMS